VAFGCLIRVVIGVCDLDFVSVYCKFGPKISFLAEIYTECYFSRLHKLH